MIFFLLFLTFFFVRLQESDVLDMNFDDDASHRQAERAILGGLLYRNLHNPSLLISLHIFLHIFSILLQTTQYRMYRKKLQFSSLKRVYRFE